MKIKYESVTGEITEVEVSEEIGAVIIDSRRKEENLARKERYHCYSLEAIDYEGKEYASQSITDDFIEVEASKKRVAEMLEQLTETQRRRLLLLVDGMSCREIARLEGVSHTQVNNSISKARKNIQKFLQKGVPKRPPNLRIAEGANKTASSERRKKR